MLTPLLGKLAAGQDLSLEEASGAVDAIMQGACRPGEIGLFLMGLRLKGETVDEVAGAASAMRRHMTPIRTRRTGLLDMCGTGGDGSGTFNISTAAALVVAAAGVPVAKHGNRKATSTSGSADVLQALGVNVDAAPECVCQCLDELGVGFCFAQRLHLSMRHVADVRRKLGVPTIFNLLGPLTNPAGAEYQVIGVGRDEIRPLIAGAIRRLGTRRTLVLHGGGLDEVTIAGPTDVTQVEGDEQTEQRWTPSDFGLDVGSLETLRIRDAGESAAIIRGILAGQGGAPRDITLANAAAGLIAAGKAATPREGMELAAQAVDSGAASRLLDELAARTQAAERSAS